MNTMKRFAWITQNFKIPDNNETESAIYKTDYPKHDAFQNGMIPKNTNETIYLQQTKMLKKF